MNRSKEKLHKTSWVLRVFNIFWTHNVLAKHQEDSLQTLQVKQLSWNKCPIARQALPSPYTALLHPVQLPEYTQYTIHNIQPVTVKPDLHFTH